MPATGTGAGPAEPVDPDAVQLRVHAVGLDVPGITGGLRHRDHGARGPDGSHGPARPAVARRRGHLVLGDRRLPGRRQHRRQLLAGGGASLGFHRAHGAGPGGRAGADAPGRPGSLPLHDDPAGGDRLNRRAGVPGRTGPQAGGAGPGGCGAAGRWADATDPGGGGGRRAAHRRRERRRAPGGVSERT